MSTANTERLKAHVYAAWETNPDRSMALTQVADDIWISDRPISTHVDPTKDGCITFLLVLLNELDLCLHEVGEVRYLRPGEAYQFDARRPHSAKSPEGNTGLFAALIWDIPPDTDIAVFKHQAEARLHEWLKETPKLYPCI